MLGRKANCVLATTADVDLSTLGPDDTLEGRALQVGDRLLIRAQSDPAENGIYEVISAGVQRAADADDDADWFDDFTIYAGSTLYYWDKPTNFTLGSSAIYFQQLRTSVVPSTGPYFSRVPRYLVTPEWVGLSPGSLYTRNGTPSHEALAQLIHDYGSLHFPEGVWLIDSAIDIDVSQFAVTADPGAVIKLADKKWTKAEYMDRYGVDPATASSGGFVFEFVFRGTVWTTGAVIKGITIDLNGANRIYDDPAVAARGRFAQMPIRLYGEGPVIEDVTIRGICAAEADETAGYDQRHRREAFLVYVRLPEWTVSGGPVRDLSQDHYYQGPTIRRLKFVGPIVGQTYDTHAETPEISFLAVGGGQPRRLYYIGTLIEDVEWVDCQHDNAQLRALHGVTLGNMERTTVRNLHGKLDGPALYYWSGRLKDTLVSGVHINGGATASIALRQISCVPTEDIILSSDTFNDDGEWRWNEDGSYYCRMARLTTDDASETVTTYQLDAAGNPVNPVQRSLGDAWLVEGPIVITGPAGGAVNSRIKITANTQTAGIERLRISDIQAKTYGDVAAGLSFRIEDVSDAPPCPWTRDGYWLDDITFDGGQLAADEVWPISAAVNDYSGSTAQAVARNIRFRRLNAVRRDASGNIYSRAHTCYCDPPLRYIYGWEFDVSAAGENTMDEGRGLTKVWMRNAVGTEFYPPPCVWIPKHNIYLYSAGTRYWLMRHPDEDTIGANEQILAREYIVDTRASGCSLVLPYWSSYSWLWGVGYVGYGIWTRIVNVGSEELGIYQANSANMNPEQITLLITLQPGESYYWAKQYGD